MPAAMSGRKSVIQGSAIIGLQFHQREVLDVRRLALAVKRHNESQADRDFRRRDSNNEKHEDLAIQVVVESRKSHKREIGRIEHQFQPHINDEQIAPDDDTKQSQREEKRADDEIMFKTDGHGWSRWNGYMVEK